MTITITEFRHNLSKYLLLAATEDVYITQNGKLISRLTSPLQDRLKDAKSLFGILPSDVTIGEAQEERVSRI